MENKKSSNHKVIIAILIVLLLSSLGYTYYNNGKAKELQTYLTEEKEEIQKGLDEMIAQYDDAIAQNSNLTEELQDERELIIQFRDSVMNLKETNKTIIRRYRKKIASLELANKELFEQNEELATQNQGLNQKIDSANVFIGNQTKRIDTLSLLNNNLTDKVAIGAILKVNTVNVISMRKRNNGQLRETTRARNTDALRVSFVIAENLLAEKGSKKIFVQIVNPAGNVVKNVGVSTLNDELTEVSYTDILDIDYINEKLEVITVIDVNRKEINKGVYSANIYLDGRFVGKTIFTLK